MRARRVATVILAAAAALTSGPAFASTYKPTRLDDPSPGKCKLKDCSLREAITKANAHAGADKVVLAKGRYRMELLDGGNDDNSDGDFDVIDEVTITGQGVRKTTVDGSGVHRVFSLLTSSKHSLKDFTVTGGDGSSGGGGIASGPAPLVLANVVVKGNEAPAGGGLLSYSTDLSIVDSTFSGNNAAAGGGIIIAGGGTGQADGVIRSSTISGNFAATGAGLLIDGTGSDSDEKPVLSVENSTVADNQASADGGGVAAIQEATVVLDNTSVGFNKANSDGSGGGSGGGIFQSTGAFFELDDSVLATNSFGAGGADAQCSGAFAGSGNVINAIAGCDSFNGGSNVIAATLIAQGLGANGGPTKTMALPQGSPAIGYVAFACPSKDQRGEKRSEQDCDAGAFERKASDP